MPAIEQVKDGDHILPTLAILLLGAAFTLILNQFKKRSVEVYDQMIVDQAHQRSQNIMSSASDQESGKVEKKVGEFEEVEILDNLLVQRL
mmetsp:Transcript_4454/g.7608  ORF Transcript_4454/g.7608 Transcript_4454/m.7608 type:complete len:90 (-) Transcript_4454:49-318(-)